MNSTSYQTIEEIRLRKAMLLTEIEKDNAKISKEWHQLFHRPEALNKTASPSKRINSLMNAGAGFVDAFLLGWKLYRKFKK